MPKESGMPEISAGRVTAPVRAIVAAGKGLLALPVPPDRYKGGCVDRLSWIGERTPPRLLVIASWRSRTFGAIEL